MPLNKLTVILLSLAAANAVSASAATTRYVNNGSVPSACPSTYRKIQTAVNASAPGDTVVVCNGIYPEQVTISTPITLLGQSGAELQPVNVVANATDTFDMSAIAAILVISNVTGVTVNGLIIDGSDNGITGCAPNLVGILVQNATATIENSSVRYIELSPSLFGCQSGLAIFAESGSGMTADVTISDVVVHDFQKNGITINETGTSATIQNNYVTGVGPTSQIAQNGIQVAFGATAGITGNVVGQNVYSLCTNTSTCSYAAEDVLVYESSNVTVSKNILGLSQTAVDIDYESDNCTVSGNRISNTLVYDGIYFSGSNDSATSNEITNSAESGVNIAGSGSQVNSNIIFEAPVGILNTTGSPITESGNKFIAVPVTQENQAPADATVASASGRVRSKASPAR